MKREMTSLAVAGLMVLLAGPASAQRGSRSLELGVKGGATFSTVSLEDEQDLELDHLTAFGGGAFLSIPLGGLYLQPEVLWVHKGARLSEGDLDELEIDLTLSYLEVPVLLVVPIGGGVGTSPYIFGGGAVSWETDCTFEAESEVGELEVDCDEGEEADLELLRKDMDYSAVFGGGLRIPTGSGAFLIEGRYTLGLTDLNDSDDPDDGFRNRSIAAFVGYSFTPGR